MLYIKKNMAAKCEMFMNYRENFIGICKTQIWLPNREYLRGHKCGMTNMAYKCKIFEAVNLKTSCILVFCIYTHMYNFNMKCL